MNINRDIQLHSIKLKKLVNESMSNFKSFLTKHPVLSIISLAVSWFVLIMVFAGIAVSLFNKEFGDRTTLFIGHLAGIICVFILVWRLGWLKGAGITKSGTYQTWLISIIGTVYFALASLYSFYGKPSFDFSNLFNLSSSCGIISMQTLVCIDEEMLFRGAILYILVRSWRNTQKGIFGAVILMSAIFALFHIIWFISSGISLATVLFLIEAIIISIWYAAMVIKGGSIWPAFLAHFVVNTVVALQGASGSIINPDLQVYIRLLLFSLPLGILGFWLTTRSSDYQSKKISESKSVTA
jgi:membrane protease YdiL (CAAX protease family)